MAYIVVYQRADGSSGVEECSDLDLAIVAAERLRNVDSVEHPRIFETKEISYDFRPYYRVEVTSADSTGAVAAPQTTEEPSFTAPIVESAASPQEGPGATEPAADDSPDTDADVASAPAPPIIRGTSGGLFNSVREAASEAASTDTAEDDSGSDDEDLSPRRGLFGR